MRFFWPKVNNLAEIQTTSWQEAIEAIREKEPLNPFHPEVLSFLQSISKSILQDRTYRRFPELMALAYWLRKAHLVEMQNAFNNQMESKLVLARGTALHFAPSNVDTIFVYSWVLSMLAGNNNILRISGRMQEQTEVLLQAILRGLTDYPEVAKRTAIVTYDHNDEVTKYLSECCHIRIIWGGDETVKAIRRIPLAPLAVELAFPDRFSLSVFDATSILQVNEHGLDDLVHRFYNDGFWFAQMACSSPRLIVWIGESEAIKVASERFWEKLDIYINNHLQDVSAAMQMQKLSTGYFLSAKENIVEFTHQPSFSRLKVTKMDMEIRERHCGGGLFVEMELPKLENLIAYLDDKDQTMSYYGFTREQLLAFANQLPNRSIDRIVPLGQALDFEGVWDGYDLLLHFTREIVIR